MTRAVFRLVHATSVENAIRAIKAAPYGYEVTVSEPKRTLPQNSKMWALLKDISEQVEHFGKRHSSDVWKALALHALGQEQTFIPSLDGREIVPIGYRSSKLTKTQMADLITLLEAWAAEKGVIFHTEAA